MQIIIRPARPEDAEEVAVLSAQLGYSLSTMATGNQIVCVLQSPSDCVLVACAEDKILGWIHAFIALRIESKPFVEIGGLVVDEAHRNRGVGKALIEGVREWSFQKGIATLRLRTNIKRLDTHRFYRHLDFRESKEQKVFELDLK